MYISIICPNLLIGGAEKVTVNLVNELINKGHWVDLILITNQGDFFEELSNKCNLISFNKSRSRYAFFSLYRYLLKSKSTVLISTLRETSILSGLVFKLPFLKQKLVLREASQYEENSFLGKFLLNFAYRSANLFIANSNFTKKSFDEKVFKFFKKDFKTVVIGNPVFNRNFEERLNNSFDHEWFESEKLKILVSCGRLDPIKRFDLLIKAFHIALKSKDFLRLILIGNGSEFEKLKNLSIFLGLESVIEIIKFDHNPARIFSKADLFVSCSLTEGFSNVLVEALRSGVKVLSSSSGGPNDILENGKYGKLVEINDEFDLAREILLTLDQNQNITENKNRALHYSSDRVINKYLEHINNIL
tara:strand:- start:578 stop:1660 length:1083 start_codon:yes stop_codon:yes gene_type:complete